MLVAAATMLFAACGKDTESTVVDPEPHTDYLICDNMAYPFVTKTVLVEDDSYQVVLTSVDNTDAFRIELKVNEHDVNRDFDLTSASNGSFSIETSWGEATSFSYENYEGQVYSVLSGIIYDDAAAVSKGRFSTTLTAEDFSTELDVLLANGHRIRVGTVTPADSIGFQPFCGG
ncbi:MAG: hypothetical protein IJ634_06335 [Bacteroidales bacterium]|nr:hypothetical protein [Bacteroidales bacterium]